MGAPIFVIEQGKQTELQEKYWRQENIAPSTLPSCFWYFHNLSSSEPLPEIREALQNQVLHLLWTHLWLMWIVGHIWLQGLQLRGGWENCGNYINGFRMLWLVIFLCLDWFKTTECMAIDNHTLHSSDSCC